MDNKLDKILAEISAGELIDKITILEIKQEKIKEKDKLFDVQKELDSLSQTMGNYIPKDRQINEFKTELKKINYRLWDLENAKRLAEKNKIFDKKFIEDARNVYMLNDERARIKLSINKYLGSNIKEVKSHN